MKKEFVKIISFCDTEDVEEQYENFINDICRNDKYEIIDRKFSTSYIDDDIATSIAIFYKKK